MQWTMKKNQGCSNSNQMLSAFYPKSSVDHYFQTSNGPKAQSALSQAYGAQLALPFPLCKFVDNFTMFILRRREIRALIAVSFVIYNEILLQLGLP